jgi:mono/diheme cytochrome c family protein
LDTNVQALFTSDCASCHSSPNPSKNLELDSGNTWAATVEVFSTQSTSTYLVDPGASESSWLIDKLEGTQTSGSQMPKGGSAWSSSDIQTVKDWIDAGAWK